MLVMETRIEPYHWIETHQSIHLFLFEGLNSADDRRTAQITMSLQQTSAIAKFEVRSSQPTMSD